MYVERLGRIGALGLLTAMAACTQASGGIGESLQRIGGSSVATDKSSYSTNESVSVTWNAMPGGPEDWISIAVAGSPDDSLVLWQYTGDSANGSTSMSLRGLAAGNYVARAFTNNDFNKIAESASFQVTVPAQLATVGTDKSSYSTSESIVVSWTGMPPTPQDWIAIAPAGSPLDTVPYWLYTGGAAAGSIPFSGVAAGTYVARIFANNSFVLEAESTSFDVSAGTSPYTLTTDAATYSSSAPVTVTLAGGPGNAYDWISISQPGSPADNVVQWTYLNGQTDGSVQFSGLAVGSYVARLHLNNGYAVAAETAVFTVTQSATVSTDKGLYSPGESVLVSYDNMAGNAQDYIAIYTSPGDVYVTFRYTNGNISGSFSIDGLTAGDYVVKAFFNNGGQVQGVSPPFTISSFNTMVSTDKTTYTDGESVVVSYSGMQGSVYDWIGIYTWPDNTFVTYAYTNGGQSGQATFNGIGPGSYIARAFFNNGYEVQAQSPQFDVVVP